MQDLASLLAAIEAAGYDWAIQGCDGDYQAVIEPRTSPRAYIGDALAYVDRSYGTPYEALCAAAKEAGIDAG